MGSICSKDIGDEGMIHTPGGTECDGARFYHATQDGMQVKTYGLFISEIFHLILSDHSWAWVTETTESKTMNKRGQLYCSQFCS